VIAILSCCACNQNRCRCAVVVAALLLSLLLLLLLFLFLFVVVVVCCCCFVVLPLFLFLFFVVVLLLPAEFAWEVCAAEVFVGASRRGGVCRSSSLLPSAARRASGGPSSLPRFWPWLCAPALGGVRQLPRPGPPSAEAVRSPAVRSLPPLLRKRGFVGAPYSPPRG